jgi:hypothetical protein
VFHRTKVLHQKVCKSRNLCYKQVFSHTDSGEEPAADAHLLLLWGGGRERVSLRAMAGGDGCPCQSTSGSQVRKTSLEEDGAFLLLGTLGRDKGREQVLLLLGPHQS